MNRWTPRVELSKKEELIIKRSRRVRPLFGFLRVHRSSLFDEEFQDLLETMYRQTGAGESPLPPAMMCMVLLLQGYVGASDAEAVELTIMDLRWQMVLDCLGCEEPLFSQGALQAFRERMVEHEMDRELLERTARLVRQKTISDSDGRSVSKALRVAMDSRPLAGAGRVEDTINLLGHAAKNVLRAASKITGLAEEEIAVRARAPLFLGDSVKASLDLDWTDPAQKVTAIAIVEKQVAALQQWVERQLDNVINAPLTFLFNAIETVRHQDLEMTAQGFAIRQGVAADRRVSIEDPQMRHGRKSRSKRFDGYKEHITRDLDSPAIVACAVTPANRPEEEGAPPMVEDVSRQGLLIRELLIDRAYVNSPVVHEIRAAGGTVLSKPWVPRPQRPGLFTKSDFDINLVSRTITCPEGEVETFELGTTVHFNPEVCGGCPRRAHCTFSATGRSVSIASNEELQAGFRMLQASSSGRRALRKRVLVEHSLAHIAARKGARARYIGTRRNLFDLRRAATIQNLEALHRFDREAA